ncbi:DUF368 domain-containing protein [Citricoccus sp.]|uniref:DUF368 domain-containing protein n=1 Tax=Citricoccus sp. TaxID=1978372 RepID=UPI0028BF2BC3|nr:DUF368 domain-containing protein [Citricoccus sp.]
MSSSEHTPASEAVPATARTTASTAAAATPTGTPTGTPAAAAGSGSTPAAAPTVPAERPTSLLGNLVRGALIGAVETVPGVSGGTVALVVGIYHQIIDSAAHLISAVRRLITGPDRAAGMREHLALVHWKVVLPVALGMLLAVFTAAGPMADAMENHPVQMRALFFGMVLASVAVPVRMMLQGLATERFRAVASGRDPAAVRLRAGHVIAGIGAAVATFLLVSLPPASVEAHPLVLVPAAMVAVSALVLPGLSGSFLLLTFGLYEPTLRAVDELDLAYLGVFALGMVLGLVLVVKLLKWLLDHRHTITLAVLSGVMVGGLRTLWPWQDESRALHAPGEGAGLVLLLFLAGFAVVALLLLVDARMQKRFLREHGRHGQADVGTAGV